MDVQNLEKNQRNKIIKELCDQGAGFRQLARITGISYGIIQRVVTDQSPLIYLGFYNITMDAFGIIKHRMFYPMNKAHQIWVGSKDFRFFFR